MKRHHCPGADCPVCEAIAEERAERPPRSDDEHVIRRAERAYERQLFGRW
jgi:hypothetical protein